MLDSHRFCELLSYIDAYNIDLKTGIASKYEAIGGDINLIERNIESAHRAGKHVELTTLVVPDFNDDIDDFKRIINFIAALDRMIPLHITRFFPAGDMKDVPPTKLQILYDLKQIAEEKLKYVYLGNV
jgi:pyruvate formate lyase activating enzyme